MKIQKVQAHVICVPLKVETWTAQESHSDVSCLLVEIQTDEGIQGYGQATGPKLEVIRDYVHQFGDIIKEWMLVRQRSCGKNCFR